jgi:D-alanyl-lipoteichoic acid acyltransferase DltB (MBOAT superfamily)
MLFNSFAYMIFLPVVVFLFWLSPQKLRTPLLLIASYVFYMSWKPIYGILIFGLTLANFFFGRAVYKSVEKPFAGFGPKPWLALAVAANLITLAYFKYAYFTHDLINQAITPFGKTLPPITFQILLPLGISFFVFEFIHYVVDIYRGSKPVKSFIDFALFASFFPTQIAGPIKRYQNFIPQLVNDKKLSVADFDQGINLILFGLFKKVIFADNLSTVVQSAFDHPELLSSADLWLAVYAFAFQIYFDFSGYTDIARGSAALFGYYVPPNFNLPYLASSISDFWRRWHISLSSWLRDYLFIPLGGSRGSNIFNYRNLLITMVLGGLWHGASMHFVVWGAYQGIMLILHKEFQRIASAFAPLNNLRTTKAFQVFSVIFTFHVVCIGWVFFRAETIECAWAIIQKLLFLPQANQALPALAVSLPTTQDPIIFMLLPLILILLFAGQFYSWLQTKNTKDGEHDLGVPFLAKLPIPARAAYVAIVICLLMIFSPDASPRFIYFQF